MCYDSVGSKDLSAKMRMKMEKFTATSADNRPVIKPAMASDEPPTGIGTQRPNVQRPKTLSSSEVAKELRELGDYFMERESYDSAVICYEHYASTAQGPKRAELYNWVGVCQLLSGNYLGARDNFKECIRLDNDYSLAYFNLGKTQYELEDYGSAAKNLEKAQEMMPGDPDLMKMLADIYYNTGKWNKSKNIYENLFVLNKHSERINYRLGDIYLRLGQWEKAVTY
ncbi:unnamed protein product [Sphagnum balticum]